LSSLFEETAEEDNFAEFKSFMVDWSAKAITENRVEDSHNQDFSSYVNSTYAFSLTDGVYTLKIDYDMTVPSSEYVILEEGTMTGDGSVVVKFDNKQVRSIDFNYSSSIVSNKDCASYFGNVFSQEYAEDAYVEANKIYLTNISLDLMASFDDAYYNQALSGYTGSGTDGQVENTKVNTVIYFINSPYPPISVEMTYNDNLKDSINTATAVFLATNDLQIQFCWVMDKNGVMSEVTDSTLVPSSQFTIYVEAVKEIIEMKPVEIKVFNVTASRIDNCILFTGLSLYDTIEAIFGLTEEQIVGIYSDSALENKYEKETTVVSEDMTMIYLVLAE
jgi:hypothetical protein